MLPTIARATHSCLQRPRGPLLSTLRALSYFSLFPKNFPHGGPPGDAFAISPKSLRREYRQLQSENHPDVATDKEDMSASINRAYATIQNPYSRIAHIIQLNHPEHLDITQDDVAKSLIASFQKSSPEASFEYKDTLMTVLEAHESLEMATSEAELEDLKKDNDQRLQESVDAIESLLKNWPIADWVPLIMEAIKVKYWVNIDTGIKEWEPGKPVNLTH